MTSKTATEWKNEGNALFSAKDYAGAIDKFTAAIAIDPDNHVLYSNRSACFTSMQEYQKALEDGKKVVELKPDWVKGYSRKGQAEYFLGDYEAAVETYTAGLKLDPNNTGFKQGLEDCKNKLAGDASDFLGGMFGPDVWGKIAMNPQTKPYLDDPDYVQMIKNLQQDPKLLSNYVQDSRLQATLGAIMGVQFSTGAPGEQPPPPAKKAPEPEPEPEPELTEEERAIQAKKEEALGEKKAGNECYKKKDFDAALGHYAKALELDPTNMTYLLNRGAVQFEQGKYEDCIKTCDEAVELGHEQFADFKLIAKAFARQGNCYMKMDDLDSAIKLYNKSLMEHRTADTLNKLQAAERKKSVAEKTAYEDPEKAEAAKELGNEHFKKQDFPKAVEYYSEAIKRNPMNHKYYSNRAGALTKLMAYPDAIKDCDKCLELDPQFVKAYLRKGVVYSLMRDLHKCMDVYEAALAIDPECSEAREGLAKAENAILIRNSQQEHSELDKKAIARAQDDPSIQMIARDPAMQQRLEEMKTDPSAASRFLTDPVIGRQFKKLMAANIIRFG